MSNCQNILILNYSVTYRLKSKGPACLLKVSPRRTLLERQIYLLNKSFKKPNIIIVSGFKHKKIKNISENLNVSIIENIDYEKTNCLYNVGLAIQEAQIKKSLLILPGNILFSPSFFNNFDNNYSQLWLTNDYQELGCTINNNKIQNIMWTLPNYWTNISYFTNNEFEFLEDIILNNPNVDKLFLFEAINSIIDKGGIFKPTLKNQQIKLINKATDV